MSAALAGPPQLGRTRPALRPFLAAEAFRLRRSRIARAILAATCITPLLVIGMARGFKTDVSTFPGVLQLIGASLWLLTGVTVPLLTAHWLCDEFEQGTAARCWGAASHAGRSSWARASPSWMWLR